MGTEFFVTLAIAAAMGLGVAVGPQENPVASQNGKQCVEYVVYGKLETKCK